MLQKKETKKKGKPKKKRFREKENDSHEDGSFFSGRVCILNQLSLMTARARLKDDGDD